jgi:hypothetical protein
MPLSLWSGSQGCFPAQLYQEIKKRADMFEKLQE